MNFCVFEGKYSHGTLKKKKKGDRTLEEYRKPN